MIAARNSKLILKIKLFFFSFLSRFWTRNRPGDTVIDKTDEVSTVKTERHTGIVFREMPDFDRQRGDGSFFLPGLDLENNSNNLMEESENTEGSSQFKNLIKT